MANSSARRPPADILKQAHSVATQQQQQQQLQQQPSPSQYYLSQKNGLAQQPNVPCAPTPPPAAATSKAPSRSSAPPPPLAAELVRPNYKGHQRRQSVARLLPDISKLRLLSWLVEASNELINCDIAIMDGVYAKLNRSRESLLFWQQATAAAASSRAPPTPFGVVPSPPSVQPVGNKTVISKRQRQLARNSAKSSPSSASPDANQQRLVSARNKLLKQKLFFGTAPAASSAANSSSRSSAQASRNHHSLPLTNFDSSSLAAVSMRSSLSNQTNDNDSIAGSIQSQPPPNTNSMPSAASNSIEAAIELMMQQNTQRKQSALKVAATGGAAGQPTSGARNNCSLPVFLTGNALGGGGAAESAADFGDGSSQLQSDDYEEDEDEEEDDDGNSSATSSTTSSGIHGASSSSAVSSSSSSSSSCASSSLDSSCPFEGPNRISAATGSSTGTQSATTTTTATTTAEQLSERIRRAVMDHNYLQNLLVNVIRHHDRQRERHKQELFAHESQQSTKLDAYGRPLASPNAANLEAELPRIDLASIAEALDDGCQCSCHNHRPSVRYDGLSATPPPRPPPPTSNKIRSSAGSSNTRKSSTLPTSSSLNLFQPANLVPSRKNRRKKNGAEAPSREDLIQKFADKLCENCFEMHYWLQSCVAIETPNDAVEQQDYKHNSSTTNKTNDLEVNHSADPNDPSNDQQLASNPAGGVGSPLAGSLASASSSAAAAAAAATAKANCNLDSIVSLRNATFIRLVQQQVRATISNSIELIDLIRREIKSPESIKQKQLMRCFSASIQLLSSVASYVVPSQDISTFIPTEMVPGNGGQRNKFGLGTAANINSQQQANTSVLFSLPPSDFDHLLLYTHQQHSNTNRQQNAGLCESFLASHNNRHPQQQTNNYHLAQAPDIPIRRRINQRPPAQRRSFDEVCAPDGLQQHPRVHLLSQQFGVDRGSFRSLPPNVTPSSVMSPSSNSHRLSNDTLVAVPMTTTNPNGDSVESSSGASSNNSSASSSIARGQVQQSSLKTQNINSNFVLDGKKTGQDLSSSKFRAGLNISQRHNDENNHPNHHHLQLHHSTPTCDIDDLVLLQQSSRAKFWQSSKFNFIKKLLQVKQQRLLRQQSKDRRIYNNKVANKFRLVMMDLTHFNKSQQLLTTENGVNSLLTSMRNVLEFGLYLTVKLY